MKILLTLMLLPAILLGQKNPVELGDVRVGFQSQDGMLLNIIAMDLAAYKL